MIGAHHDRQELSAVHGVVMAVGFLIPWLPVLAALLVVVLLLRRRRFQRASRGEASQPSGKATRLSSN
jgi:uncharacterized membrane protein